MLSIRRKVDRQAPYFKSYVYPDGESIPGCQLCWLGINQLQHLASSKI